MKVALVTDVGKVRRRNEDAARCGEFNQDAAWGVVCDGMGGAVGGSTASSMAVEMIAQKLSACYRDSMRDSSIQNMLLSAVTTANVSVFDKSQADASLKGMGTTVVAAVVREGHYCIAHAGDSRAYVVETDSIAQITKDHSVVQQMFDRGELSAEQMKHNPIKNVITRALGVDEDIELDFDDGELSAGQVLLLCSDGLSNYVDDADIIRLRRENDELESFLEKLVQSANGNGGGDNITAVAMEI